MLIRPATGEDVEALSKLIVRTVRISNTPDYEAAAIEELLGYCTPQAVGERMQGRDVFVAVETGRIVGTVSYGDGRLRQMYVAPGRQKAGVGRRLVEHLEAHARALGLDELKLASSFTARGFYERMGYRTIRYQPQGVPTWLMGKRL
jgi:GNAT superfamily N-acetyltransferase